MNYVYAGYGISLSALFFYGVWVLSRRRRLRRQIEGLDTARGIRDPK